MSDNKEDVEQEKIDQHIYRMLLVAVSDMSNVISILMRDSSPIRLQDKKFVDEMLPKLEKFRKLADYKVSEINNMLRDENEHRSE